MSGFSRAFCLIRGSELESNWFSTWNLDDISISNIRSVTSSKYPKRSPSFQLEDVKAEGCSRTWVRIRTFRRRPERLNLNHFSMQIYFLGLRLLKQEHLPIHGPLDVALSYKAIEAISLSLSRRRMAGRPYKELWPDPQLAQTVPRSQHGLFGNTQSPTGVKSRG
jgi:hypothetical protein